MWCMVPQPARKRDQFMSIRIGSRLPDVACGRSEYKLSRAKLAPNDNHIQRAQVQLLEEGDENNLLLIITLTIDH